MNCTDTNSTASAHPPILSEEKLRVARKGPKPTPSKELLDSMLSYDPETGSLKWKERDVSTFRKASSARAWKTFMAGKEAGSTHPGHAGRPQAIYVGISVQGKSLKWCAHRIAWVMMTGSDIPDGMQIDHKNGNPCDNRWDNLRLATFEQNMWNAHHRRKVDLPMGVYPAKSPANGFYFLMRFRGKNHYEGGFKTAELASQARMAKSVALRGEFCPYVSQPLPPAPETKEASV